MHTRAQSEPSPAPGVDGHSPDEDSNLDAARTLAPTNAAIVDVSPSGAAMTGGDGGDLRTTLRALFARAGMTITPPGPRDYVLLIRGVPVAPWIPLRPAVEVWGVWLRQLEQLYAEWCGDYVTRPSLMSPVALATSAPAAVEPALLGTWDAWQQEHVLVLDTRHTLTGVEHLARILTGGGLDHGDIHVVGHSVGGATALGYLAGWRAGLFPPPLPRLRTVITLDAAVSGPAAIWSGVRQFLARETQAGLRGLGAWTAEHDITVLTATNERDVWSHRAVSDLPYLGMRLGPSFALRAQLNGTIHGWLRRAPQFVEALWSTGHSA